MTIEDLEHIFQNQTGVRRVDCAGMCPSCSQKDWS